MSSRWLPKWKVVKIKVGDKDVEVCYDDKLKLYCCPLCSPECKKGGIPDYSSYFYSIEDLDNHLIAHKDSLWLRKGYHYEEEEEEDIEQDED
ncbi:MULTISPECIES: hypothetical protein [Acidianus]|uniref:Uncharacterized protein n=1 Tax=Candidatus Acidianus copahuensis TaxID=1160895 RepID=A0A031LNQ6_9CREN|nr:MULTISPECIES: hypothetical protein [Acidianus]EZQ04759.1 hypothetical protein CM19_08575 [Candidatus Acidianus copahuensis]NON63449.1 hypothetical protein [Acidianus sp. RZ1]